MAVLCMRGSPVRGVDRAGRAGRLCPPLPVGRSQPPPTGATLFAGSAAPVGGPASSHPCDDAAMTEPRIELRNLADFSERDHAQLAALREEIDFGIPPRPGPPRRGHALADPALGRRPAGQPRRHPRARDPVGDAPLTVAGIRSVMTLPARAAEATPRGR